MIHVPDHKLLRLIGRGSYGEVWLAMNVMGTHRAVKIVRRSNVTHERPYEREYAGISRFEPISRTHEGFVDILQIGHNKSEGYFYYVMELADGIDTDVNFDPDTHKPMSLQDTMQEGKFLSPKRVIKHGLALSDALIQLHSHGLIHRDIKPANIVFVDGHPKLADIGLVTAAKSSSSKDNTYVGTDGYIPPEGPGTEISDIYSLGMVLYEISTGKDRLEHPEMPTMLGGEDLEDDHLIPELNHVILQASNQDKDCLLYTSPSPRD